MCIAELSEFWAGKLSVIFRQVYLPTETQQRSRKNAMLLFMIEFLEVCSERGFHIDFLVISPSSPEKRGQLTGLFEAVPMTQYDEVEV